MCFQSLIRTLNEIYAYILNWLSSHSSLVGDLRLNVEHLLLIEQLLLCRCICDRKSWMKKGRESLKISIQVAYVAMNVELVHKLNLIFTANKAIQIRVCSRMLWFSCSRRTFGLRTMIRTDELFVHKISTFVRLFFLLISFRLRCHS